MDLRTAEHVAFVARATLGIGLQADLLMCLVTRENVTEVMESLPPAFRDEFVAFAREAYVPEGDRLVLSGSATSAEALGAIRSWLADAPVALQRRTL